MEYVDFTSNLDWDPVYLSRIFESEFEDYSNLWDDEHSVSGREMMEVAEGGNYCPIVEDISIDDDTLCSSIEEIETQ